MNIKIDDSIGFAEYLRTYIKEKKLTWKKAAELCDVERSLLMRYAKGEKIPRDKARVIQMVKGLFMDNEETEKLLELYEREKIGVQQFWVNKYMDQKLRASIPYNEEEHMLLQSGKSEIPKEICLRDKSEICRAISEILHSEEDIYIMTSGSEDILSLFSRHSSMGHGRIHMIVEQNFQNPNWIELQKFDQMIAFLLKWENSLLECVNVSECVGLSQNKVQLCFTDSEVLVFDAEMQRAYYSREKKQILFYQNIFKKQSKRCTRIGCGIEIDEIKIEQENQITSETHVYQVLVREKGEGRYKIGVIDQKNKRAFLIENSSVVHWIRMYIENHKGKK